MMDVVPDEDRMEDSFTADEEEHKLSPEEAKEQLEMTSQVISKWLCMRFGKARLEDVDPWAEFPVPMHTLSKAFHVRLEGNGKVGECLNMARIPGERSLQFFVGNMRTKHRPKLSPEYDTTHAMVYSFGIIDWDNPSPFDLSVQLNYKLSGVPLLDTYNNLITENFPGYNPDAFGCIPKQCTKEKLELREGNPVPAMYAFGNVTFGPRNPLYLMTCGALCPDNIHNGILSLPYEMMDALDLSYERDADENASACCPTGPSKTITQWLLVPKDHILAWSFNTTPAARKKNGIYAWEIRGKNLDTGRIFSPYWLVPDNSLNWVYYSLRMDLLSKTDVRDVSSIAVEATTIEPDPEFSSGKRGPALGEETDVRITAEMKYVCFKRGVQERKDVAPRLHPDFPPYYQFTRNQLSNEYIQNVISNN